MIVVFDVAPVLTSPRTWRSVHFERKQRHKIKNYPSRINHEHSFYVDFCLGSLGELQWAGGIPALCSTDQKLRFSFQDGDPGKCYCRPSNDCDCQSLPRRNPAPFSVGRILHSCGWGCGSIFNPKGVTGCWAHRCKKGVHYTFETVPPRQRSTSRHFTGPMVRENVADHLSLYGNDDFLN